LARVKRIPSAASQKALETGLRLIGESDQKDWLNWYRQAVASDECRMLHVHVLNLSDLLVAAPLSRAKPRGWRFHWPTPDGKPVIHEVSRLAKRSVPKLHAFAEGAGVAEIRSRFRRLESLGVVDKHDDLRVISIPALQVEAMWIKSAEKGEPDKIVPFVSLHAGLRPMTVLTARDFFAMTKGLAATRLAARKKSAYV